MPASGQFGHYPLGIHAAGEHVAMIAIAGDHLVTLFDGHLHANDDRLLPDVQMAETSDQPHAIELTCFFLEAADAQHVPVGTQLLLLVELRYRRRLIRGAARGRGFAAGYSHFLLGACMPSTPIPQ